MRPRKVSQPPVKGEQFSRWTVICETTIRGGRRFLCRCVCGTEREVRASNLLDGSSTGCGCWRGEARRKHGHYSGGRTSKTASAWQSMHSRCYRVSDASYQRYGGRGIRVCPEWHNFESFLADMGECAPGMSLDRVDNNRDYSPSNCRWAALGDQARNRACCLLNYEAAKVIRHLGRRVPLRLLAKLHRASPKTIRDVICGISWGAMAAPEREVEWVSWHRVGAHKSRIKSHAVTKGATMSLCGEPEPRAGDDGILSVVRKQINPCSRCLRILDCMARNGAGEVEP